jgi:hypothetical protein
MATIHHFEPAFDGRNTRIMYEALDLACAQLGTASRPHGIRKLIAQRILKAMETGERNTARLCIVGLSALGPLIVDPSTRPTPECPPFPAP